MAAEINLFKQASTPMYSHTALLMPPVQTSAVTFTTSTKGIMRVYANAVVVVITVGGIATTIPSGGIEYFGVQGGTVVTVS